MDFQGDPLYVWPLGLIATIPVSAIRDIFQNWLDGISY
jgi:hypothetical protein